MSATRDLVIQAAHRLTAEGHVVALLSRKAPFAWADLLAFAPGGARVAVVVSPCSRAPTRRMVAESAPSLAQWLAAGGQAQLWSYAPTPRGGNLLTIRRLIPVPVADAAG